MDIFINIIMIINKKRDERRQRSDVRDPKRDLLSLAVGYDVDL